MHNDEELARIYAFNSDIMSKNNVILDFDNLEYSVDNDINSLDDIMNMNEDIIDFEIKVDHSVPLKINQLIRHSLGISINKLEKLINNNSITILPIGTLSNHKIKNGTIIRIEKDMLTKTMDNTP